MLCLRVVLFVLAISGTTFAGYSHGGTSYTVVTKHDAPHYSVKYGGGLGQGHYDLGHYGIHLNHGLGYGHGAHIDHHHKHDYYKYPKYQFDYGVKDLKTGDIKNQWEHRDGGLVKGGYSLKEADGTTRVVEYHADDHNGFNAIVKKIGHAHHPDLYAKSHHYGADNGYGYATNGLDYGYNHGGYGYGLGHEQGHGHASSYVNVKQL
uniref:Adult-specific cuticular protein ACP-20-like n=1 Tax=Stomoxys calcitrans TaxID=35570 RepID=A0A1I8P8X9_STOCA